jgi:hypothetical protein
MMQTYRPIGTVRAGCWTPADPARQLDILDSLRAAGVTFSHTGRGATATLVIHQGQHGFPINPGDWILLHGDGTVTLEDSIHFPLRYAPVGDQHGGVRNSIRGDVAPGASVIQGRNIHWGRQ